MTRSRLLTAAALLIAVLAVFAATGAHEATLVDAGELIVACATLGVAHPPGFPVYTLLGFLFSKLPLGSVAFRLSLMSAFFAAAATSFLFLALAEVLDRRSGAKTRGSASAAGPVMAPAIPAATAALLFAFASPLWSWATTAEVYTLNLALLAAAIWLLLVWRRRRAEGGPTAWILPTCGLVCGLGLGTHHLTTALALPALTVLVLHTAGFKVVRERSTWLGVLAAAASLSTYLYLPLACARRPIFAWGRPDTWDRLVRHVVGQDYRNMLDEMIQATGSSVADRLGFILGNVVKLPAILGIRPVLVMLVLVGLGLWWLWRHDRGVLWASAILATLGAGFALRFPAHEDLDAYYLTTLLAASVALGAGLIQLVELAARWRHGTRAALAVFVALVAVNLLTHWPAQDLSRYRIARTYVDDALAGVGQGGLLLTQSWRLYSPFLYYHHVEGLRPDVAVIDVHLVRRSWYVEDYLEQAYPEMMAACRAESDSFLEALRPFEEGRPFDPPTLTKRYTALMNAVIAYQLPRGEVHLTLPMQDGVGSHLQWVPQGLTFRVLGPGEPFVDQASELDTGPLRTTHPEHDDPVARSMVRDVYAEMLSYRGHHLRGLGALDAAETVVRQSIELRPASSVAHQILGDIESARGRRDAAVAAYREAVRLNPGNGEARRSLEMVAGGSR